MKINKNKFLYFFLIISAILFSLYCIFSLGLSYDQVFHIENGERRLKYLFSLGRYDYYDILHLRYYPGLYDTISALLSSIFPRNFYYESFYLLNFIFGLAGLIGLKKIVKFFFGSEIAKYFFLISIFSPIIFGHLSINPKDTIIATSHFWILYYVVKYLKTEDVYLRKNISFKIGIFVGLGTGVRVIFLGTLIPIILFLLLEILIFKKFIKKIILKDFIYHITIIIFSSYILLVLCWPNTHSNILVEPFKIFFESLNDISQGVQVSYFKGIFYETKFTPWNYLFTNVLYKFPSIFLFCFLFFFIFYKNLATSLNNIKDFDYKILISLILLILPVLIAIFLKLKIHDGLRYFLYLIPIFNFFPAIYLYYLLKNLDKTYNKVLIVFLIPFFIIFLIKFFVISPYHYTYLNVFNDIFLKKDSFENDYWGTSLKELIKKFSYKIDNKKFFKISVCGANPNNVKYYLRKYDIKNFDIVDLNERFDYAILVNRAIHSNNDEKLTCYLKFNNKNTYLRVNKSFIDLSKIVEY